MTATLPLSTLQPGAIIKVYGADVGEVAGGTVQVTANVADNTFTVVSGTSGGFEWNSGTYQINFE